MPTKTSGPNIYANLIYVGWPIVAAGLVVLTGSVAWGIGIMLGVLAALLVAHQMVLSRTALVPITEAEVRYSRKSAMVFAAVLLVVAVVVLGIRAYDAV